MRKLTITFPNSIAWVALFAAGCAFVTPATRGREIRDALARGDRVAMIYLAPPPAFFDGPGPGGGVIGNPVLDLASLALYAHQEASRPAVSSQGIGAALTVAGESVRQQLAKSTPRGDLLETPTVLVVPAGKDRVQAIRDLRSKEGTDPVVVVMRLDGWGLTWWQNFLYRLNYNATIQIYLAGQDSPAYQQDCRVAGGRGKNLNAERADYAANGGALLRAHVTSAAQECGEELAGELARLLTVDSSR